MFPAAATVFFSPSCYHNVFVLPVPCCYTASCFKLLHCLLLQAATCLLLQTATTMSTSLNCYHSVGVLCFQSLPLCACASLVLAVTYCPSYPAATTVASYYHTKPAHNRTYKAAISYLGHTTVKDIHWEKDTNI